MKTVPSLTFQEKVCRPITVLITRQDLSNCVLPLGQRQIVISQSMGGPNHRCPSATNRRGSLTMPISH